MSSAYEVLRLSHMRENIAVWVRLRPLILAPLMVTYVTLHVLAGVSHARLALMVAGWSVLLLSHLSSGRRARAKLVSESSAFWGAFLHLTVHGAILSITGGLRSALIPMLFGPAVGALITHGRGVKADVLTGYFVLLLAVMGVLPAWWVGERIRAPYDAIATGLSLTMTLLILRYTTGLLHDVNRRVAGTLSRMRDDVISHATERARSLETVSARVAHELKNPLAAIKGLVQLMARAAGDDKARERLRVVGDEVLRMEEILRDYLSLARPLEVLKANPVELMVLADDVVAVLEARAEQAGVRIAADGVGATVTGDVHRLKEALLNLVANAIEATPRGGAVRVTVRPTDEGAELVVRDSGVGMAPEVLARVGTAYFTTREEGTGLGVVLARTTIEQHGGTLTYESARAEGTRVRVRLPRECAARLSGGV